MNRGLDPVYYTIIATAYGLSLPTVEEDIKTINVSQLWQVHAKMVRVVSSQMEKSKDYGLSDD